MDAIGGDLLYDLVIVFPPTLICCSVLLQRYGLPEAAWPWWMRRYVRWNAKIVAFEGSKNAPIPTFLIWLSLVFFGGAPLVMVILIPAWGFQSSVPGQPVLAIWVLQIAALCLQIILVGPSWLRLYARKRASE